MRRAQRNFEGWSAVGGGLNRLTTRTIVKMLQFVSHYASLASIGRAPHS